MKVNGVSKPPFVAEAPTAHFDCFDPAVDGFRRAIAHLQDDRIEDTPQVFFDGSGGCFERFQPTPHGPGQPLLPTLTRPCGGGHNATTAWPFP